MNHAYESKFKNMSALVERYVGARVDADIASSLDIEQEIKAYLDANTDPEAQNEQQHLKALFADVMGRCDSELGPLGSLDILVLDPIKT